MSAAPMSSRVPALVMPRDSTDRTFDPSSIARAKKAAATKTARPTTTYRVFARTFKAHSHVFLGEFSSEGAAQKYSDDVYAKFHAWVSSSWAKWYAINKKSDDEVGKKFVTAFEVSAKKLDDKNAVKHVTLAWLADMKAMYGGDDDDTILCGEIQKFAKKGEDDTDKNIEIKPKRVKSPTPATKTTKRACSYCKGLYEPVGHYKQTCPKRLHDEGQKTSLKIAKVPPTAIVAAAAPKKGPRKEREGERDFRDFAGIDSDEALSEVEFDVASDAEESDAEESDHHAHRSTKRRAITVDSDSSSSSSSESEDDDASSSSSSSSGSSSDSDDESEVNEIDSDDE